MLYLRENFNNGLCSDQPPHDTVKMIRNLEREHRFKAAFFKMEDNAAEYCNRHLFAQYYVKIQPYHWI